MRLLLLSVSLLLLTACSQRGRTLFTRHIDQTTKAPISRLAYTAPKIVPHDRLSILFFEYPELSTHAKEGRDEGVEVMGDGTILLPIVGRVEAAGLTTDALTDRLYRLYSDYLEKPALTVHILDRKIYVIGEVHHPGPLPYDKTRALTPLKAIAEAGGLSDTAARNAVYLLRGNRKEYDLIKLDMSDLHAIAHSHIRLLPGDIIYAAPNRMKRATLPLNGIEPALSVVDTIFNALTVYKVWN